LRFLLLKLRRYPEFFAATLAALPSICEIPSPRLKLARLPLSLSAALAA
jgi:hypothetical protein